MQFVLDVLRHQSGMITSRQMTREQEKAALKRGIIEPFFGETENLQIADDVVFRDADVSWSSALILYAPVVVATRCLPVETVVPLVWQASLEAQNVGPFVVTSEGRDVAVPASYTPNVIQVDVPHKVTAHSMELRPDEWCWFEGIPVQRADLAIKHLAVPGMVPDWIEAAVVNAYDDGLASIEQLGRAIDNFAREYLRVSGLELTQKWIDATTDWPS